MAARVYSQVLWQEFNISGVTEDSFEVPPGFIWIVRDIVVGTTYGSWVPNAPVEFSVSTGEAIATVGADPFDPGSRRNHWEGRQVLETGDYIVAVVNGNAWSWRISGYVLSLP